MRHAIHVPIIRLPGNDLPLPEYQSENAAAMDLHAVLDSPATLNPGEAKLVGCGIAIAVPAGFEAQVRPRSGLALKHRITVLNAPGTIDSDYRGEIQVILINHGSEPFSVVRGMRIAQLLVFPVPTVKWDLVVDLPTSKRGSGGFGHTGQ